VPQVLTEAASITCGPPPHAPGAFKPTAVAKLTVEKKAVLTQTPVTAAPADGKCQVKNAASGAPQPCTGPATITAGFATKLTAGKDPVVLATLAGTTSNPIVGKLVVVEAQTKLSAV
jgi:hypothetical protein